MAVLFLYYGTQVVAAPFFHAYSFMRQAASLLGSNLPFLQQAPPADLCIHRISTHRRMWILSRETHAEGFAIRVRG